MDNAINLISSNILIVENEPADGEALKQMLGKEGYNIIQAKCGEEALEIAPRSLPDLFLIDVAMPTGMDGFETCMKLKEDKAVRDIPVIFISEKGDSEETHHAFQVGAVDFITRPFKKEEIQARVKTQLSLISTTKLIQDCNQDQILEEKLKNRVKDLYDSRLEIIRCLGLATEYCDHITPSHVLRISSYCALLGNACGMNQTEVDLLSQVSPLYDIGKIGIPDEILLKAGKLKPDEAKIVQKHVAIGAKILSGSESDLINMAKSIAETHHERWDGFGYMKGLKGKDIPLVGRISALCSVYEALTSDRPFRKSLSAEDAMVAIEKLNGKHFDPHLVKLFKKIFPEIQKIKEQFPD